MISKKFRDTLRLHHNRHYVVAQQAGIHPSTLSKLLNGIENPSENDPRVIAIGEILELSPDECFSSRK
ncbi:helix-turn-helix transcriptional regulator [Deltaproteobacteria bacterium IMCC39524]|nr:helix-turn-helix transcriptional regulator [Deltaproteobacteria bacterium IMCC39524]